MSNKSGAPKKKRRFIWIERKKLIKTHSIRDREVFMLKDRSNFAERLQQNFDKCFIWEDRAIPGGGVWLDRRRCGCYLYCCHWNISVGDHFCSEDHRLGLGRYLWGDDWRDSSDKGLLKSTSER